MDLQNLFQLFFGIWIILGIISFVIFVASKNAQLKRMLWPHFIIITALLLIGFAVLLGFRGNTLFVMIPVVVLVSYMNIRAVRFCDACGKTVFSQNPLQKPKYCSDCGAKLK